MCVRCSVNELPQSSAHPDAGCSMAASVYLRRSYTPEKFDDLAKAANLRSN